MVAHFLPRKPAPKPKGPKRYVMLYAGGNMPKQDVETIRAVPGLTIEGTSPNVLLVTGPTSLRALKAAIPQLLPAWTVGPERFYTTQGA